MQPARLICFANAKTHAALPEDFDPSAYRPPAELWQGTKSAYAKWQGDTDTDDACLYSVFEGLQPHKRVTKENPPARWLGVAIDYDHGPALHDDKVVEYIGNGTVEGLAPTYWYRTKSGGVRLLWLFEESINTNSWDPKMCEAVGAEFAKKAGCNGFSFGEVDATSFRPTQRFDAGAEWHGVGDPVPVAEVIAVAQKVAASSSFDKTLDRLSWAEIEKHYKACQEEKGWPEWPSEFRDGAVGPPFWDSSIETRGGRPVGMYSNGVHLWHGTGTFIPWSDDRLFGKKRTRAATEGPLAAACTDIVYASGEAGGRYYTKDSFGQWEFMNAGNIRTELIGRGMSSTKEPGQTASPIDQCLAYIMKAQQVKHVMELSGVEPGVQHLPGYPYPVLNAIKHSPVLPDTEPRKWGEGFPQIAGLLERLFDAPYPYGGPSGPGCPTLSYFVLWCRSAYESHLTRTPSNRYAMFLCGAVASGKTVFSDLFASLLGGKPADAERWLYGETPFNRHLFGSPVLLMDDPVIRPQSFRPLMQNIKQCVAAQSLRMEAKGLDSIDVPNCSTLLVLTNDHDGARLVPAGDPTMLDKICALRTFANERPNFQWPEGGGRGVTAALRPELPAFGRFLMDFTRPAWIEDGRYCGFKAYQDPAIMELAVGGPGSDELLAALCAYAEEVTEWEDKGGKVPEDLLIWEGTAKELCDQLSAATPDASEDLRDLLARPSRLTYRLNDLGTAGFVSQAGQDARRVKTWRIEHKCLPK